jgi:hypothetical protein
MTGFKSPNYTQTPNDLFDEWLPDLGYAALKVLLVVVRYTFGFHTNTRRLSITTMEKLTGLSRQGVQDGAAELETLGLVKRAQDGGVTIWKVVVDGTILATSMAVQATSTPSSKESTKEIKLAEAESKIREPNTRHNYWLAEAFKSLFGGGLNVGMASTVSTVLGKRHFNDSARHGSIEALRRLKVLVKVHDTDPYPNVQDIWKAAMGFGWSADGEFNPQQKEYYG